MIFTKECVAGPEAFPSVAKQAAEMSASKLQCAESMSRGLKPVLVLSRLCRD